MSIRTMDIVCIGCGSTKTIPHASNVGAMKTATGFNVCFNVRDGLTTSFVCPTCAEIVRGAVTILRSVFKEDLEYIHLPNLLRF